MHKFKCTVCGMTFVPNMDSYNVDPATRNCPKCKKAKGKIAYLGHRSGAPNIISDDLGIGGVLNPATGKKYDSKSAYYRDVRAAGYEIVGNEKMGPSKPKLQEIDWEQAVAETLNGRKE